MYEILATSIRDYTGYEMLLGVMIFLAVSFVVIVGFAFLVAAVRSYPYHCPKCNIWLQKKEKEVNREMHFVPGHYEWDEVVYHIVKFCPKCGYEKVISTRIEKENIIDLFFY